MSEDMQVFPTGQGLAIFDLDYTLTKRGTWGRFIWERLQSRPYLWLPAFVSILYRQALYKLDKTPRVAVKRAMMRWALNGAPKDSLTAMGQDFARREVASGLRPGALAQLRAHQKAGDKVIVISAAADIIAEPIGALLGVEHVLATQMGWDDGKLAADFASANCYGAEKTLRLKALLRAHPALCQKGIKSVVYSDSASDIPLMDMADNAVAVCPNKAFTRLIEKNGYDIARW